MKITTDWHIHTRNSCDEACITVADLVARTARKGITDFGISDHIHTPFNRPDIVASRKEYLESHPGPRFHFGIEVSCVSQWEIDQVVSGTSADKNPVYGLRQGGPPNGPLAIALTQQDIDEFGIEYVIGGTHWPMYVPFERKTIIREYHRQNMFLATHSLVTIVAHPWWWFQYWQDADGMYRTDPWLDDFGKIPQAMHDEFADAVLRHNKIVEINMEGILFNATYTESFKRRYLEYLAELHALHIPLSIGSDTHDDTYHADFDGLERMLDSIGITEADLWTLPPRK